MHQAYICNILQLRHKFDFSDQEDTSAKSRGVKSDHAIGPARPIHQSGKCLLQNSQYYLKSEVELHLPGDEGVHFDHLCLTVE